MSLAEFRTSVQAYRRKTGHTQQQLGEAIGLHPNVLSHKLNGKGRFTLTREDVKKIVKTLAAWAALTTQHEAFELLGLVGVPATCFTVEEWRRPPLNHLQPEPPTTPSTRRAESQVWSLPTPISPLIGREQESKLVRNLLENARLVTLTGPGGIGKTRLALRVATDLRRAFNDRIAFVSLDALREPALVPASIAHALRIKEEPQVTLEERIAHHVGERSLLLVLDTFEHLLPGATVVADLLALAPGLKIIVTSRIRLRLYGEYEFRVPALGLPGHQATSVAEILQSDAVRLFVERVRAARGHFELNVDAARVVATLCERLDGVPLAVELAAAHTRAVPLHQLLAQLSNRLTVLTGGPRNVPERQQTLKRTLDWSYHLLTPNEQRLFACLSVFVGNFDAQGAAAVYDAPTVDVLEQLTALVDKSLLESVNSRSSTPRFRMLDTVREYAGGVLVERGTEVGTKRTHAKYFLAFAEAAQPELIGPQQVEWLDRLETEHDNLRSTLEWSLEWGEGVIALRLGIALWRYWMIRGHLAEGQQWLTLALAVGGAANPALRAAALRSLGNLMYQQANYEEARQLHEEALVLHRTLDDLVGVAAALGNLGLVAEAQGDDARAGKLYEETLALYRELGNTWAVALTLGNLGSTALRQGSLAQAREQLEESLSLFRQLGDVRATAAVLANLGKVAHEQGNHMLARQRYSESLRLSQQLGDKGVTALCLEGLATIAAERGVLDRAAQLWGAAEALRETVRLPLPLTDLPLHERRIEKARAQLGNEAWHMAWQHGRGTALETVIHDESV